MNAANGGVRTRARASAVRPAAGWPRGGRGTGPSTVKDSMRARMPSNASDSKRDNGESGTGDRSPASTQVLCVIDQADRAADDGRWSGRRAITPGCANSLRRRSGTRHVQVPHQRGAQLIVIAGRREVVIEFGGGAVDAAEFSTLIETGADCTEAPRSTDPASCSPAAMI